jgi:uncharacterized membrane protein YfcA
MSENMKQLLIYGLINLVASTLSGAAGGGAALISIPTLLLLGLSPTAAIASSKFSGLGISSGTSLRFYREKLTDRRTVILFSVVSALGAVIGSLVLIRLSHHEDLLQHIMGWAILIVGIPMLYVRGLGLRAQERSQSIRVIGFGLLLITVIFQAALSSGLGSLQMLVMMGCFGMTALVASATRRFMQLTVATISLAIFIIAGFVNYRFGVVALVTSAVGGYLGAHIAVKKGDKFVINLFAVTSAILAIQLLWR